MSDPLTYLFLCGSALLAGVMNSVAGGGTLLTFPSLLGVVPPVVANATSTVALLPGSVASAWGYRRELAETGRLARWLILPSLLGGVVGALLLTLLDPKIFADLIPWLILSAAVLFLVQKPIARWVGSTPHGPPTGRTFAAVVVAQFFVAVYGGYFGAGIGILMLAALGFMGVGDIHRMNAVKNTLACVINGVAVVIFVALGRVEWRYALPMVGASIAGGYLGASVARRLPAAYVRWTVVAIGFGLAGYYFVKQFGGSA